MGARLYYLKTLKVVQNTEGADLTVASAWSSATNLGELKGKPFVKLTWKDDNEITTQKGKKGIGVVANFETSTFEVDSTTLNALKAMRGKNVSLQCTPQGTVSATNPIIIIKDFPLMLSGEINIGGEHFLKLSGEKYCFDESDFYQEDSSEL